MPGIERAEWIDRDFKSLWKREEKPYTCPSTIRYIEHMEKIKDDPEKLMAHIYVRHLGDLSGGQMLRKKVPGPGMMFKFKNPNECKRVILHLFLCFEVYLEPRLCWLVYLLFRLY